MARSSRSRRPAKDEGGSASDNVVGIGSGTGKLERRGLLWVFSGWEFFRF